MVVPAVVDLDVAARRHPGQVGVEGLGQVALVGDVGPEVGERVSHLAEHAPHLALEAVELGFQRLALGLAGDPVELEGHVGQRLADPVVHVAGDPRALLGRAHGP